MSLKIRSVATALGMLASSGLVTVATAGPAGARPIVCENESSYVVITSKRMQTVITHNRGYQLPPGGAMSITKSTTRQKVLTSNRSVTAGVTVSASSVIAKADAKIEGTIAKAGEQSRTTNMSVTSTIAQSNRDRYYAVYAAYSYFKGNYEVRRCSEAEQGVITIGWGTWRSFRPAFKEGIALCPSSRYPTGSAPYKACKQMWN